MIVLASAGFNPPEVEYSWKSKTKLVCKSITEYFKQSNRIYIAKYIILKQLCDFLINIDVCERTLEQRGSKGIYLLSLDDWS